MLSTAQEAVPDQESSKRENPRPVNPLTGFATPGSIVYHDYGCAQECYIG